MVQSQEFINSEDCVLEELEEDSKVEEDINLLEDDVGDEFYMAPIGDLYQMKRCLKLGRKVGIQHHKTSLLRRAFNSLHIHVVDKAA
jgi:hypothetical protein